MSYDNVITKVMTIEAAAGQMLKLPRNNPKILEKAVKRLEPLLWPSHYVLLELNIALIFLYLDSRHRRPGEPRITFHLTNGRMHFVLVVIQTLVSCFSHLESQH